MVRRDATIPTRDVAKAYRDDWHTLDHRPTESQLRREIAYYEGLAAQLRRSMDPSERWKQHLYKDHASHRRKLLAALRDGRPEAWVEYPG